MINSLLDTDFYKFTMAQAVFYQFPDVKAEYKLVCRTPGIDLNDYKELIIKNLSSLFIIKLSAKESSYLKSLNIFKDDFLDYLKSFCFNPSLINLEDMNDLRVKGLWLNSILYETPILATISETYMSRLPLIERIKQTDYADGKYRLLRGIRIIEKTKAKIVDFGTRRRFSKEWHALVIQYLIQYYSKYFIGTSNIYFAMKNNIKPIGTMAHEWLQAGQVLAPVLRESQVFMLKSWLKEYPDKLGIALTDVINMDAFLDDFNAFLSATCTGCRHDSGDPFKWGERLIDHYYTLAINPRIKTAVFSDKLTWDKINQINEKFKSEINTVFGIGTNLTNNVGPESLDIVLKLVKVDGKPVAKISDTPQKSVCEDEKYIKHLIKTFSRDKILCSHCGYIQHLSYWESNCKNCSILLRRRIDYAK